MPRIRCRPGGAHLGGREEHRQRVFRPALCALGIGYASIEVDNQPAVLVDGKRGSGLLQPRVEVLSATIVPLAGRLFLAKLGTKIPSLFGIFTRGPLAILG